MTATSEKPSVSWVQRVLWVCNTLFHNTVAIITFFVLYIMFNNNNLSSKGLWHAFWSTIAYVPLMAEGLVLFTDSNSWTLKLKRTTKYYLHGILLLASVITITAGIVIDYQQKESFHGKHFTSKHAKLGLASWILCFISVLFGLFAFYSQWLRRIIPPVYVKFLHNICGIAAFVVGMASLCLALDYGTFSRFVTKDAKHYTLYTFIAITIWSTIEALRSLYTQVRAMIS